MDEIVAEFDAKYETETLKIVDGAYWRWSLRPQQCTLGAGLISLRRPARRWSETTEAEAAELHQLIKEIEARLARRFAPDKLNYLMLMMIDPSVHFHLIPRFADAREFAGLRWEDAGWPGPPNLLAAPEMGGEVRDAIRAALAGESASA